MRHIFRPSVLAALSILCFLTATLRADPPDTAKKPKSDADQPADKAKPKKSDERVTGDKLTVAILDFSARDPANPDLGKQIGEALTAGLSAKSGFRLVDRQSIRQTVQEHSLNLTGLVDTDQAIQVGKLVGARIIITGSAFTLGKQMTITAKLIGTETSLVDSVAIKDSADADLGSMVDKLSEKVAGRIREAGSKLVAAPADEKDPVAELKAKLAGRKLPTVAVIITEEHHAAPTAVLVVRAVDPPVETEMKHALIAAGFTVQDVPQNDLEKFAQGWKADDVNSWPRGLSKVDVLIAGESFSEFAGRVDNLTSCSARAEINIVNRADGKIVQADQCTARAADLSENIAAKTALQKTGHAMAIRTLDFFVRTLPPAKPKAKEAAAAKP